jgi:hypothetical protein
MKWKLLVKTTPFVLALTWALVSTGLVLAVTYWNDTQTITQSFGEGGTATFKNLALPVAYLQTPDQHIEQDALNVTTYVPNTTFTLSQTTSQRTNIGNSYVSFILVVRDAVTNTVAGTFDMKLDLTCTIPLALAGSYNYDYEVSYESLVSSGTVSLDLSLSLIA